MADDEKLYVIFSTHHQSVPRNRAAALRVGVGIGDAHNPPPITPYLLTKDQVEPAFAYYQSQGFQTAKMVCLEVNRVVPHKIEIDFEGKTQS